MTRRTLIKAVVVIALLVVAAGNAIRWRESANIRESTESFRREAADLDRLQTENRKLVEQQIPTADLERLRADHAALPRIRSELEALNKSTTAN